MEDKPLVSVIILNYNGGRYLGRCLSSVFRTDYPRFEVILVDNASTDGSVENAYDKFGKDERLRIIRNLTNLGFGPANNVGFKSGKGVYVAFLNNDTVVHPNWLTVLVDTMEKDKTIGLAQSMILKMDGSVQTAGWLISDYFVYLYSIEQAEDDARTHGYPEVFEVSYASGTAMIVRREIINEVGLFDPKYFWFYDDNYLSFKIWLAGKRVVTVSNSKVYHVGGGTAGVDNFPIRCYGTMCLTSLIFDTYWRSADLAKAIFVFYYNLTINALKETLEHRKTTRFRANISAGFWVLSNLKYVWRNRLRYLVMAKVSQEWLLSKFIRIRIPMRIYLVPPPVKLLPHYMLNEAKRCLETLMVADQSGNLPT
jgi:GT2 family glycosyltransferase